MALRGWPAQRGRGGWGGSLSWPDSRHGGEEPKPARAARRLPKSAAPGAPVAPDREEAHRELRWGVPQPQLGKQIKRVECTDSLDPPETALPCIFLITVFKFSF